MNRHELADFLRGRREALSPAAAGVPERPDRPRRTPGLRREEVAWLAGVSTNYYERLEQARGSRPSPQVLSALGRALRLSDGECTHLAVLAGQVPTATVAPAEVVPAGVLQLLDRLGPIAAVVLNVKHDILAWNAVAVALITDFSRLPAGERNALRLSTRGNLCDAPPAEEGEFARHAAADLRQAAARYPAHAGIADLIRHLNASVPEFAAGWRKHDVRARSPLRKRIRHAEFGLLELDCQTLHLPDDDLRLVTYSAEPGSPAQDALERMRLGIPAHSTMRTS